MRTRWTILVLIIAAAVAGAVSAGDGFSYVYRRGDRQSLRVNNAQLDRVEGMKRKYGNEFVWVHSGGRAYVIRDAVTLAEVRKAFQTVEELEPSLQAVADRLKPFESKIEAITGRIDALAGSLDDESLSESGRHAVERKMHAAEMDMSAVERQMEGIEREMEKIEREIERRDRLAEAEFERVVHRAIESGRAGRAD